MTLVREFSSAKEAASSEVASVLPLSATVVAQSYGHSFSRYEVRVERLDVIARSSLRTGRVISTLASVAMGCTSVGLARVSVIDAHCPDCDNQTTSGYPVVPPRNNLLVALSSPPGNEAHTLVEQGL